MRLFGLDPYGAIHICMYVIYSKYVRELAICQIIAKINVVNLAGTNYFHR